MSSVVKVFCGGVECYECGAFYIPSIVKNCSNNLLNFIFFILVKFIVGVIIWYLLYSGYVIRSSTLMRTVMLVKGVKSVVICVGISQCILTLICLHVSICKST